MVGFLWYSKPCGINRILEELDSPNVRVCLDVGHVNVYSSVPLEEWIDSLAEYIVKVHINGNDAQNDLHLAFGEGNIDFQKVYRVLGRNNISALMTLEMPREKLPKTIKYIKEKNLQLPRG